MPGERPLNDHELRMLRGMIDEYTYSSQRKRFFSSVSSELRRVLIMLGIVVAILVQAAQFILIVQGHGR